MDSQLILFYVIVMYISTSTSGGEVLDILAKFHTIGSVDMFYRGSKILNA